MTIMQSIILGVIQGATEFIPISSSGHLVIAPLFFGWTVHPQEAFVFDVLAQVATLIAVLIYYWKDLLGIANSTLHGLKIRKPWENDLSRLGWYLILSTIPAGIAGLLFKDTFEKAFSNPRASAYFLFVTSGLLLLAELIKDRDREVSNLQWVDAIWIGFFQVLALFPGISRSGSTISGGMLRGMKRPAAARYSFLMAVPVMGAAGVLAIIDLIQIPELWQQIPVYLAGFVAAALVGYLAIRWLINYLSNRSLYLFSIYCACLGGIVLLFYYR